MSLSSEEHAHVESKGPEAEGEPKRSRGRGSHAREIAFRDPPSLEEDAKAIRSSIAQILLRAPKLPLELPLFRFSLIDIGVDRRGLDLIIGWDQPVARIRIQPVKGEELVELGKGPQRPKVVTTSIEELNPVAARIRQGLERLAERVEASVTQETWDQAWARAKDHLRLPIGVPIGFYRQMIAGMNRREGMIRVGFKCNQDCGMCWQGRDWGRFGPDQTLRWIEDLADGGAQSLIISGGEPTLDPELESYVRRARERGIWQVILETNAIQFQKAGLAERIRDAGLDAAFVSLHSGDADVSDEITRAPGTHARTVKGVLALLEAGVKVKFNAVMSQEGLDHLAGLPDFIQDTFGAHRSKILGLMLSYPSESFDPSLAPKIIPDPVKLRRVLRETIDRAVALKLHPHGLDSPCGPQLCAFGADRRFASLRPIPEVVDFRNVYLPACEDCTVRRACFGLRDTDVKLYGDACVAPLKTIPRLGEVPAEPVDPAI
jgi:sulfatase maturation enzyme AslB (radical SAM superfamily)